MLLLMLSLDLDTRTYIYICIVVVSRIGGDGGGEKVGDYEKGVLIDIGHS